MRTIIRASRENFLTVIKTQALNQEIDWRIVDAIVCIESNYNPLAARFEPLYRYFYEPGKYAKNLHISDETERCFQRVSWGLSQIMGGVGRELGYIGPLQQLCEPEVNIYYCCKLLKKLMRRYGDQLDVISSYNAGSPRRNKETGLYSNQAYVDKVLAVIKRNALQT